MPIYLYECSCGLRFERLVSRDAQAPDCPQCAGSTRKIPAAPSLGRRVGASPAKDRDRMSPAWQGLHDGGPERMQREVAFRAGLVAKAGDAKAASADP